MITADKLALLSNMPAAMLTEAIRQGGYKEDTFKTAKFVGLTNAGLFCYNCTFKDKFNGMAGSCHVFLDYNHTTDSVTADY
jgi:hypothetical protein